MTLTRTGARRAATLLAIAFAVFPALAQAQASTQIDPAGGTNGINSSGSSTVGVGHPAAASGNPNAAAQGTGGYVITPGIPGGANHTVGSVAPATPAKPSVKP